jgi:hypothetical protein
MRRVARGSSDVRVNMRPQTVVAAGVEPFEVAPGNSDRPHRVLVEPAGTGRACHRRRRSTTE